MGFFPCILKGNTEVLRSWVMGPGRGTWMSRKLVNG